MRKKTLQETYDFMVSNMTKQGKKATGINGFCMYLTPDGNRCAVGFLIEDPETAKAMNGEGSVSCLPDASMKPLYEEWGGHLDASEFESFLRRMQNAHDNQEDDEHFAEKFLIDAKDVGHAYGLTV